jgi:heat shock protein HslJ
MTKALITAGWLMAFVLASGGDDDGEALATLEGTSWSLAEGEGMSIPDDLPIAIAFAAGRVSGSSGCNRFTGMYQEDGDSISFGPLAGTRMACADEVMTVERAYLAALDNVSRWSATTTALTLSDQAGQKLLRYETSRA